MKLFIVCTALSLLLSAQSALAQSTAAHNTTVAMVNAVDEDDLTPDIGSSAVFEYHCEMNDFLTIYTNADDNDHIAMRWKSRLHRLRRIATTTGANRFENKKAGLVWIGIPSKGMLLDSRHGLQLANECKTSGQ